MNITRMFHPNFCRLAMTFLFTTLFFGAVNAAVFTVTKTADTNDGVCNADCSLREAVTAANNTVNDDIIEFAPAVFSTAQQITLTTVVSGNRYLLITNNGTLTINGPGANLLTISGNNSDRIFQINANANVAIRRLTITHGLGLWAGGCLDNRGGTNTTLEDVIVFNCRVFVTDPIFTIGGGTIVNGGTMNIVRSSIQSGVVNRSQGVTNAFGGGIYNLTGATLKLISSSVTNNTITGGNGGGIRNDGQLIMINSTVSGNEATDAQNGNGGGISNTGVVNILHSTIAYNRASTSGGGVFTSEANNMFNSRNSIYSNNTVGANERDFNGTLISGGYNLIKDTTDTAITGDTTGNILNIDPLLQPLTNFGGLSYYHLLSQVSPAMDKGKTFDIFNDQRGLTRPFDDPDIPNAPGGDGADIGSVELQNSKFSGTSPFDFDGDHQTDISIFRPANGEWWINRSSSNVTAAAQFGSSTDKLVPADYTGDGKADIAFYRPSEGNWYVLRSENSTFYAFPFGIAEDIPAPGDYDGDGRADAAVYRASQGIWYIFRSSDAGVTTRAFGIAEDQPVVADYDGDGKDGHRCLSPVGVTVVDFKKFIRSVCRAVRANRRPDCSGRLHGRRQSRHCYLARIKRLLVYSAFGRQFFLRLSVWADKRYTRSGRL